MIINRVATILVYTICILTAGHCTLGFAMVKDPIYDELEGFQLVEALIRDHKLSTAQVEMLRLPKGDRKTELEGDLFFAKEDWKSAAERFQSLPLSAKIHLKLGRTHFRLLDAKSACDHFQKSGSLWQELETDILQKAAVEMERHDFKASWQTLNTGWNRHHLFSLKLAMIDFLVRQKLVHTAFDLTWEAAPTLSANQLLATAEIFLNNNVLVEAEKLVTAAQAIFPQAVDTHLAAAQIAHKKSQPFTVADGFWRASRLDPSHWTATTELFRGLGFHQFSRFANQNIKSPKDHLRQMVALNVKTETYAELAALDSQFLRSPESKDDEVSYALAYALFRQGRLDRALRHLQSLDPQKPNRKAAQLRQRILNCERLAGSCQG